MIGTHIAAGKNGFLQGYRDAHAILAHEPAGLPLHGDPVPAERPSGRCERRPDFVVVGTEEV